MFFVGVIFCPPKYLEVCIFIWHDRIIERKWLPKILSLGLTMLEINRFCLHTFAAPSPYMCPPPLMSYDPIATPYAHMWQKMCQFWVGLSVFAWLLLLLNGWKLLWVEKKITLWTFVNTEWIFCSIVSSSSTLCPKVNK